MCLPVTQERYGGPKCAGRVEVGQVLEIASLGYLRVGEVTAIWGLKIDVFFGGIFGISQKQALFE